MKVKFQQIESFSDTFKILHECDLDMMGLDDHMAETTTDQNGFFQLEGKQFEISSIDPALRVRHDCEDILPCQRRILMTLPKKYVMNETEEAEASGKLLNLGIVNLEAFWRAEVRSCVH